MINIPTIISIMFCCICAMSSILGIYTICSDSKSMTNKLFFALTISLVLWSLGLGMAVSASDLSVSLFWRRFSALGWGTFFSIMLHFLITFTERSALLNRRWKYILLYSPSLLLILGFSYFTGLNHEQYNLIRTPLGWANVAANNYWDWFFNIYYLVYFGIGLYFVWKLRKTDISKNKSRQSKLIFVSFLITILIGAFVENYLNTLFSVKIPQIAPILMIYPMTTIYYAMRKFGLFNVNQNTVDSILFSRQIQQRIINYLSISFIAGSILNIIAMYLILKDGDTVITVLFSLFLIFLGFVFQIIQRLNTDNRTKEIQYAAAFFLIIPIITLRFIGYCSESIWAFAFIILIIAIVLEKKTIQIAISVSVLLTQVIVLLLKPISTTTIDIGNHFVRISLYAIAIWIAFL